MSAITKGPWRIGTPHPQNACAYVVCDTHEICSLYGGNENVVKENGVWGDSPVRDANAKAIAALPDLIEALRDLMRCCEVHPAFTKSANTITAGRMDAARAALTKAGVLS